MQNSRENEPKNRTSAGVASALVDSSATARIGIVGIRCAIADRVKLISFGYQKIQQVWGNILSKMLLVSHALHKLKNMVFFWSIGLCLSIQPKQLKNTITVLKPRHTSHRWIFGRCSVRYRQAACKWYTQPAWSENHESVWIEAVTAKVGYGWGVGRAGVWQ